MMRRKFSKEFKDAIITKALNRGNQTLEQICSQEGVGLSSLSRWVRNRGIESGMKTSKCSQKWSAEEKLKAIFESNGLNEEELGAFLRQEGLHSHQLKSWRAEILQALDPSFKKSNSVKDGSAQKIKELERDLNRKDKALAEASALLILQKKVNLIWGNKNEDEK